MNEAEKTEEPCPPSFYCPISQSVMHDPVLLCDGHSYERRHINRWLFQKTTSPVTGVLLPSTAMYPNHALRNAIEEHFNQVLSQHHRALRKSASGPLDRTPSLDDALIMHQMESLVQMSVLVGGDQSAEKVLHDIVGHAKQLVGAEVASLFLVDQYRGELYSTINSTDGEIRIPISAGIAGLVASTGIPVLIPDAYSDSRFNQDVDKRTGFQTRNIVCVPIKTKGAVIGVAQFINKLSSGGIRSGGCASSDADMAIFSSDDQRFLMIFAGQAAAAIVNSGASFEPENSAPPRQLAHAIDEPDLQVDDKDDEGDMSCTFPFLSGLVMPWPWSLQAPGDVPKADETEAVVLTKDTEAKGLSGAPPFDGVRAVDGAVDGAVAALLEGAFSGWHCDTLALHRATGGAPLSTLAPYLLARSGLVGHFRLAPGTVRALFARVELGYDDAHAYHNKAHAAAVLHQMHALLRHGGVARLAGSFLVGKSGDEEEGGGGGCANTRSDGARPGEAFATLAGLFAGAVHDFEHRGVTNGFLVNTGDERAVRYNDRSVNENHHAAAALALLARPELNFLSSAALPPGARRQFRHLVISMVLATDMAEGPHILQAVEASLANHKAKRRRERKEPSAEASGDSRVSISGGGVDPGDGDVVNNGGTGTVAADRYVPSSEEEALLCLQLALKCADVGHLAAPWGEHVQWVTRLEHEFFAQGDREKAAGLPPSFLCDREKPGVTKTQVGFFTFVVSPLFATLGKVSPLAAPILGAVAANGSKWAALE